MAKRMMFIAIIASLIALVVIGTLVLRPKPLSAEAVGALYATPLPAPEGPIGVYHLGHSLVGRDMPAMLAQLAPAGHRYDSQLGWGTSLREHWEPDLAINGFDAENAHPRYRDARAAIASGEYDAVVLTEMVEIKDAISYHDSTKYLGKWADLARSAKPAPRVYLYETWHPLDDADGWLTRLDNDLANQWEAQILLPNLKAGAPPIYLIPAGQVMAALVRAVETQDGVGPMHTREDLFQRREDGTLDQIHVNDLGAYLVALTHYAVLYGRSPVGLPYDLTRADGSAADSPGADLAAVMQATVWRVVTSMPKTGVAP
ncbi:hypothetical protein OO012_02275 [Rhodobacteraceae bacterium KMM 6894]|nr:hypothetical protein [Rhodobacteraceae bacterium KMM 6894]